MRTLTQILQQHGGLVALQRASIRLERPPFMALHIEYLGTGPRGYPMISVAHYGQQHGDAMRDPDMVFELAGQAPSWIWAPVSWWNDYVGVYHEAVWVEDEHVMIDERRLRELRSFAKTWDRTLHRQGFDRPPQAPEAAAAGPDEGADPHDDKVSR
ncbi:MAG: DUF6908 domain-containing protein [Nitrospirota bacterium]